MIFFRQLGHGNPVSNNMMMKWIRLSLLAGMTAYVVLVYCEHGGMDLMGLKPSP